MKAMDLLVKAVHMVLLMAAFFALGQGFRELMKYLGAW